MKKIIIGTIIVIVLMVLSSFIFKVGIGVSTITHITGHNPTTGTACICVGLNRTILCVGCGSKCIGFEFGCKAIENVDQW